MKYNGDLINKLHELDSRKAVGFILEQLHNINEGIVAVYADVGSRFAIKGHLGDSELEIGISEQSLIPILGGMAHEGFLPFGIAYAPFITMRAADQIRMTIGQMNLNIKLVGGSAGLISGNLGAASLSLDDVAMMRAIPNVIIMSPSDSLMEAKLFDLASKVEAPVYLRLTGGKVRPIYNSDFNIEIGKSLVVFSKGTDAVIYSTGAVTVNAIEAAKLLADSNINATVIDVPFIKPLDTEIIDKYSCAKIAFTVEEHNVIGGLGGAVVEYLAGNHNQKLIRIGCNDSYLFPDTYENLIKYCMLDIKGIYETVRSELNKGRVR